MPRPAVTCPVVLLHCPIVVRGPANGGTNVGATHSHTPENIFCKYAWFEGGEPGNGL